MNTRELVTLLADKHDLSKAETRRRLDDVVQTVANALADNNHFTIPGLGTFELRKREKRKSYNPNTKSYMILPPKRVVHFKPGKALKEKVK